MPDARSRENPRFALYFDKRKTWREEFFALRELLLAAGLDEELKWRQPCYTYGGANIVILSGFKNFCALGFFKGVLLPDPAGVLESPGVNSKSARLIRFTSLAEVRNKSPAIKTAIKAAIAVEKSGAKVDFSANKNVARPKELLAAFITDAAYRKAFDALTPGRQRGWILLFESARQEKTENGAGRKGSCQSPARVRRE